MSADEIARKKRIWGTHRAAASQIHMQVEDLAASTPADPTKAAQLRLSLAEKLKVLKDLDTEIFDNTPEEELVDEIQQANECKDEIFLSLAKLDNLGSVTPICSTIAPTVTAHPQLAATSDFLN